MKRTMLIAILTAAGMFAQSTPTTPTTKTTSTAPAPKKTKKAPKSTTAKPASSTKVGNKKAAASKTAVSAPAKQ